MWKTHHESRFPNGKPWVSTALLVYPFTLGKIPMNGEIPIAGKPGILPAIHRYAWMTWMGPLFMAMFHRLEPFGTMKPPKSWVKVWANIPLT
jgi:hypothetical protein